jgi:hypothetical protein
MRAGRETFGQDASRHHFTRCARGDPMNPIFGFFNGDNAPLMASVVAFVACFLIARLFKARQGVAFAFAFAPLLIFFAVEAAMFTTI